MWGKFIAATVAAAALALSGCDKSKEPITDNPNNPDDPNDPNDPNDPGTQTGAVEFGTQGPWAVDTVTYGSAQGLTDGPVVGASSDEAQNRWAATSQGLYLLKPGASTFIRFGVADGLHLTANPVSYDPHTNGPCKPPHPCETGFGTEITAIVGGGVDLSQGYAGEVFVGYRGLETYEPVYGGVLSPQGILQCYKLDANLMPQLDPQGQLIPIDGDFCDKNRHSGKLDRVRLKLDGTLQVDRIDLAAIDHGMAWWHNRTVHRMLFDHFIHKHELYVGTNHGITLLRPDIMVNPGPNDPWADTLNRTWMADHVHPRVCANVGGAPCIDSDVPTVEQRMGDWRGLGLAPANPPDFPEARLWVAGKWTAGAISWVPDIVNWWDRPGNQTFAPAFGDPYIFQSYETAPQYIHEPVFRPPLEGDPVALSSVAVTPDGKTWFGSAEYGSATGVSYGLAAWVHAGGAPDNGHFDVYDPVTALGFPDKNVVDLVALPDGRLILASNKQGVYLWRPGDPAANVQKLAVPDNDVRRLELDTMVNPPALYVSTASGITVVRSFP